MNCFRAAVFLIFILSCCSVRAAERDSVGISLRDSTRKSSVDIVAGTINGLGVLVFIEASRLVAIEAMTGITVSELPEISFAAGVDYHLSRLFSIGLQASTNLLFRVSRLNLIIGAYPPLSTQIGFFRVGVSSPLVPAIGSAEARSYVHFGILAELGIRLASF